LTLSVIIIIIIKEKGGIKTECSRIIKMSCEMGGEGPNTSLIPNIYIYILGIPWPTHHQPLRHQLLFWYVIYIPFSNYRKHGAV
jgi:hypothetical protein